MSYRVKIASEYSLLCYHLLIYLLTYVLTPWCRVLLEKLTGLQLVKKFPAFHGTRSFITALTSVRHLSLSWASPIQSIYPHSTSWRSILILSTHLRLGLPIGLLPSGFPTKTLYTPSPHPYAPHMKLLYTQEIVILLKQNCTEEPQFSTSVTIDNLNNLILHIISVCYCLSQIGDEIFSLF